MLMSDGPWSPEHIYQEIVGYGKTWHRGEHETCNRENAAEGRRYPSCLNPILFVGVQRTQETC